MAMSYFTKKDHDVAREEKLQICVYKYIRGLVYVCKHIVKHIVYVGIPPCQSVSGS